jgi:uncharacterized membrane protein HdeD (DUF308 family)
MAKSSIGSSGILIGILAIVAGVVILFNLIKLSLIVGIFLIVFGIVSLIRR